MVTIETVAADSCAASLDLQPGDRLLSINGQPLKDLLDYQLQIENERLVCEVLRQNGEQQELEILKERDEDPGIGLRAPAPRQCGNQCLFCFVHQLPRGLRPSLYIKDEDYRYSYLYGAYITLTNLTESDLQRIIEQHLSPLYISVHATDEAVRRKLLGSNAPPLMPLLERLTAAGIELHCQVVLCPGLNDGAILRQTIVDLAAGYPQVSSLAVVPVGLTRHRQGLPRLAAVDPGQARVVIDLIEDCQQLLLSSIGSRFVFAADEFYLRAARDIPPWDRYEEFPQLENGVGLIASFRDQMAEVLAEADPLQLDRVTLVSGRLFAPELQLFLEKLQRRTGVQLDLVTVDNDFFGHSIGVAGLLTGRDLLQQLVGRDLGKALLLPDVMLKAGEAVLLDDVTLEQLEKQLHCPVLAIESSPWGLLEGLESLADCPVETIICK